MGNTTSILHGGRKVRIFSESYFFHRRSLKFSYYLNFFKKNKNKTYKTTRAAEAQRYIKKNLTHNLTPLPLRLIFSTGVPLRRFLRFVIDIKSNTAAETQRHIKNNLSSLYWSFFFACVSLRLFFAFGASSFQSGYPHFNIYSRKGTGAGARHMILTFFVEDSFVGMTANNINVSAYCTLRLIGNTKNSIKKKGPQNTQKYTEVFFIIYLYSFCVFLCVLWALNF